MTEGRRGVIAAASADEYERALRSARSRSWLIEWELLRELCTDTARTVAYYREDDPSQAKDTPRAVRVVFEVLLEDEDHGGTFGASHGRLITPTTGPDDPAFPGMNKEDGVTPSPYVDLTV